VGDKAWLSALRTQWHAICRLPTVLQGSAREGDSALLGAYLTNSFPFRNELPDRLKRTQSRKWEQFRPGTYIFDSQITIVSVSDKNLQDPIKWVTDTRKLIYISCVKNICWAVWCMLKCWRIRPCGFRRNLFLCSFLLEITTLNMLCHETFRI